MTGTPHRLRRAAAALAVLSRPESTETPGRPDDPAARFLSDVLGRLGDLTLYCTLDVADSGPRLILETSVARRYSISLPSGSGPYELWAAVEMPVDSTASHFVRLREREEVLSQALQTQRLAWHQGDDGDGWIGLPVALAKDDRELDEDLGTRSGEALRRLFFTVERICAALDDRDAARKRRRQPSAAQAHRRRRRASVGSDVAV
jgi:hypothetical protein